MGPQRSLGRPAGRCARGADRGRPGNWGGAVINVEILTESGPRGGVVCRVLGEVDVSSAEELQACVLRAYASSGTPVTLDLSGVRFMDCAGLNALLRIRARMFAPDLPRDLRLSGLTRQVARLLAVSGAAALFETSAPTQDLSVRADIALGHR